MTRLRAFRSRLICRWFGHRGPYWWEYAGSGGDACVRCEESLWGLVDMGAPPPVGNSGVGPPPDYDG